MEIKEEKKPAQESIYELVRFALIAIIIVIPIRVFIAQPFVVSGSSMVPTFKDGDYLIVDEISYRLDSPKRGDVVVFRYPNDPKKFFIKRIIGLPGEQIEIQGSNVIVINKDHPDGLKLEQPYVKNNSNDNSSYQLSNDEYFVMGDNRSGSSDSRYWGPLNTKFLIGKAFLRVLPVNKMDVWPGNFKQVE